MQFKPRGDVVRANVQDAEGLSEFGARLFRQTFAEFNSPATMELYLLQSFHPMAQRVELADPERATFLAKSAEGTWLGYLHLRAHRPAPGVAAAAPTELLRLYVDVTAHGTGVAQALMRTAIQTAREWGADALWLGVWERNLRAKAFYAREGMERVGEKLFDLGGDVQRDEVWMLRLT